MSLSDMVAAARDGKVSDFDAAFQTAMANKVAASVDQIKSNLGASLPIDGEIENGE